MALLLGRVRQVGQSQALDQRLDGQALHQQREEHHAEGHQLQVARARPGQAQGQRQADCAAQPAPEHHVAVAQGDGVTPARAEPGHAVDHDGPAGEDGQHRNDDRAHVPQQRRDVDLQAQDQKDG